MSEYSVVDRQPEAVELDGTGGNTLLVAAPALGPDAAPSELISPVAVADRLNSGRPLGDEASADGGVTTGSETSLDENADVCVLPDLYAAYCEADDAAGLTAALDSQTPLAAVVAPHELDWLLRSDSAFAESHLGGFDRIVQLRYDPGGGEADETVRAAVDAAAAALAKDDLSEMDRRAIWSALESFAYSHEYSHEALADAGADGQYGPTLTPGIATYVSTEGRAGVGTDDFDALAPKAVRKTFDPDASADGLLARGQATFRDLMNTVSGGLGVSNATSAVAALAAGSVGAAGGPAAAAAIGFAAWAATREGDDGVATVFQLLDDGRVPPPTQAQLEASLGVPPGTVETTAELVRPGSLRRLREIVDDAPEAIREVETALDATDADGLGAALSTLDRRTASLEAVHKKGLVNGAKTLDAVAGELKSDEAALLGPLVDPEEIDPDQIPWVEVIEEDDGDSEAGESEASEADDDGDDSGPTVQTATRAEVTMGDEPRPRKIREVVDAAGDGSVVVLRGGHGTGKTTATYRAGRALEEEGYTVRVPGFTSDCSMLDVRRRLSRDAGDDPLALVISHERPIAGETLDEQFGKLRDWIDEGFVDTVLVECREEFYDEFTDENNFSGQTDELIEFERFDSRVAVSAVAEWVFYTLARVGELAEPYANEEIDEEEFLETVREVLALSRGNSEVAKVAAKFAFAADYSLEEVNTHDDLIRADVRHLIETLGESTEGAFEEVFSHLATARELRTQDLLELHPFDGVDLRSVAASMSGYLNPAVRRALDESESKRWTADRELDVESLRWRLSPSLYTDVTFRRMIDESDGSTSAFEQTYEDLQQLSLGGENPPQLHRNVASNFRVAHETARQREQRDATELDTEEVNAPQVLSVSPERVETQAREFVEQIDGECEPGAFVGSLFQLSSGLVSVDPSVFDDTERLLAGADTEASHRDVVGPVVLQNILGSQLAANVEDSSSRTALTDDADAFAAAVAERDEYDPAVFLENVYSIAIKYLADSSNPADASEWTEWVTQRADTAAIDGSHDDPAEFLGNVYSTAIKYLANLSSPAEVSEWTEWVTQQADTVATDGSHDLPPGKFLSNVYTMAIKKLADSSSPAEASEWTDRVYEAIRRYASSDTHDRTRDEFVADCCAMALAKVTPKLPAIESTWHADILTRSLKATPSAALTRFYARYANLLTQVDVNRVWQSWIVTDCLNRTIHAEQPVTDDPEGLAASVVANTLCIPAANADNGLMANPELPDTVAKLATDREAFETVLDSVETRYADGDVSELVLNDPESTDVQAVGQRVLAWVRGRAFVHAVTDDADTVAADICDAAVETTRESSEPEVPLARFYTVALVGLAAETDPENAGAHDDLLGDALQREAIKSLRFCLAYFRELSSADSLLPDLAPEPDTFEWHLHLVDDLLTRAETDAAGLPDDHEQTGEMIARMLATMADWAYPASGPTREFHTLFDTVADHDTDAAVTAHAIECVPELLDEEHANLLAKFDWEERFV